MNQLKQFPSSKSSFAVHSSVNNSSRRAQSAHASPYLQPVESLTVSFAKLLVNQINGASTTSASANNKRRKKNKKTSRNPNSSSVRTPIRNNQPVTQIDHVEDWLHQRSAHYAWWRKPSASPYNNSPTPFNRTCCDPTITKTLMVNHSQPHSTKAPRCILWFQFTGNPSKRPTSSINKVADASLGRMHSIRIEQQPLGGANALVFAADLHIGEDFAIVSRRQPGFTFSLTFFIDGVRHARLSGCCENARNIHVPTRVGGPIGAFVLRTVQGGEQCHVCEKSAPFADPELFTVWPKSQPRQSLNSSQESERSQDTKHTRKHSSSLRRPKIIDNPPVQEITISLKRNQSQDATATYSNDFNDEQPSLEATANSLGSADDTCEIYEDQLDCAVLLSESNQSEFIYDEEHPSKEVLAHPQSTSIEEVYEEQPSSEIFPTGSVSVDEVVSVASSTIRTPQLTPSSFLAGLKEH